MNNIERIEYYKEETKYLRKVNKIDPTEQNRDLYLDARERWQNEAKKGRLLDPIEKKAKEGRLKQEKKPHEQFKLYEFVK